GNWLWWASWIIWMPLVAIIWAPMWRRMGIVTTAELLTLRYGGKTARLARQLYALFLFGIAVLVIGYITGFFAKTIAPIVPFSEADILLVFGGVTVIYTLFGGLVGVVFTDVIQFFILLAGNFIFLWLAVHRLGGWTTIVERAQHLRPEALQQFPPTQAIPLATFLFLIVQGLFFAGSPTAGEGMTAQRFLSAKNERHAMGGQFFNAFLALSLRTLPLIGLGMVAISVFWSKDLIQQVGPAPSSMRVLSDPAYAWGELVKFCKLPPGLVGMLVAAEAAAFMSTLSSLINWGSSFVVNDFYNLYRPGSSRKTQVVVSRLTTLFLFVFAALVAIFYVQGMVSWFLFINSVMVVFILPLSWLRFFWWRFNVWGELSAIVLSLPLSILVWFVLDFQSRPLWQGAGFLFLLSFALTILITLLTPPESQETLTRFYKSCRPPGLWDPVRRALGFVRGEESELGRLVFNSALGIATCLGLVVATNAIFTSSWALATAGIVTAVGAATWLLRRVF
ncbi:MAG: sodium:solute symporter, partial [Calditrichaeota bacterium]|nr:sodium:solute symporter [Calditrichota bacterium]